MGVSTSTVIFDQAHLKLECVVFLLHTFPLARAREAANQVSQASPCVKIVCFFTQDFEVLCCFKLSFLPMLCDYFQHNISINIQSTISRLISSVHVV